jgi:ankyrin repeat protein
MIPSTTKITCEPSFRAPDWKRWGLKSGMTLTLVGVTALLLSGGAAAASLDDGAAPPQKESENRQRETRNQDQTDQAELERRREAAREALRRRHEEAVRQREAGGAATQNRMDARPTGTLDTSPTAPGARAENDVVRLDPPILDMGEMIADVSKTMAVKVRNISDGPVTIGRIVASCGCTTAPAPTDPIAPGAYAEIPVTLAPGGRQGVSHNRRVTIQIDGHAPVVLTVQGRVAKHIDIQPEMLNADPDAADSGRIALSSADGEPFRILAVNPAIVRDVPQTSALEHDLMIDWELWERSGRGVRVTFTLDHPQMPAVSAMIRPRARAGDAATTRAERPNPITPINPNTSRLIAAAKIGDLDAAATAIQSGAIIDEPDQATGRTALLWAAREGHPEVIELLLLAGASVEVQDRIGKTALSTAAETGRTDAVRLLLDNDANINHRDRVGGSPLLWAAGLGNAETVQLLIERGADVAVADTNGLTPLIWAAGIGDPRSVRVLLEAKADTTTRDRTSGDDALIRAARSGKDESVKYLLAHGARVDSRNTVGMTALHMAASVGGVDRVKMLVEAKSDLKATCDRGWTALDHARNRADADRDAVVAYLESL